MRLLPFLLAISVAGPAKAQVDETYVNVGDQRARLIACFEEVLVPARYKVTHTLLTPAKRQYVKRRKGRIELVEIPAVYVQERTMLEPEYVELREIPCD